jgi:iron complex outermembrane receptor protein
MMISRPTYGRAALFSGTVLSSLLFASAGLAQISSVTSQDRTVSPQASSLDEVIVTGTRRAERTVSDSSVPVDVVSNEDLSAVPSADLNDKLAQSVPSFNVQRLSGFDGGNFVRPATLRGLSPDQTLVLVNGKRRHRSAYVQIQQFGAQAVDLSEIPQIAIRQVEVLRDGASAQYGSDAIAGVINILLEDRPGAAITAQASQYFEGDGTNYQIAGRLGTSFGETGVVNLSLEHVDGERTNRWTDHNPTGQPDLRSTRGFANVTYDLGGAELYGFGNYGRQRGEFVFGWRDPTGTLFDPSFYQTNAPSLYPGYSLRDVYPDGFNPHFISETEDASIVGGARGQRGALSWDFSGRYGRNQIDYRVENSINASLGPLSPTEFDAGSWIQTEKSLNADFGYLWDVGLFTPVNVSFGAEWRNEEFELRAGELASYVVGPLSDKAPGSNSYPGPSPDQAGTWDRDSYAAYVDIDADITERLSLAVAGRYEDFSDFGDTWNFKVSGRYTATDWLNLRGGISTGFHAPSPGQQNLTQTTQNPDPLQPPPAPQVILTGGLIPSTNPVAQAFGGQQLRAEEATNYSLGLVLHPTSNFTLSVDLFRIEIDDRLGITSDIFLTPANKAALAAAGITQAASLDKIRFFINGYNTRTDGIDVVGSWRGEVGPGRLGVVLAYNHTESEITGGDPLVVNDSLRAEIEDRRPKDTGILTGTYDIGPVSLLARARYYGEWVDALPFLPASILQKVGEKVFVDLSASYALKAGTVITAGVENAFDEYPDTGGPLTGAGIPYPLLRPYEADGGRYYLRFSSKF